jgi:Leucine-rich repeat (LRR) protein
MKNRILFCIGLVVVALLAVAGFLSVVTAAAPESDDVLQEASVPEAFCDNVTEIPTIECEALVALYNSTDGSNWANNTGWLTTDTPCNWFGVTCSLGYVYSLSLPSNQLTGTVPTELSSLANLGTLDLASNHLTGTVPTELSNLASLRTLNLASNHLMGNVPAELGNLASLQTLDLSSNEFTGSIPQDLSNLSNLRKLSLLRNQLTGTIPPELGNLTNLQFLSLSLNKLTGTIPPELGNFGDLEYLSLATNQLTGGIPPALGNLASLQILYLGWNQLTGTIPPELGNLVDLWDLHLDLNQLSGAIPPELGNLTNLQRLWLDHNQLTGSIPPQLGDLALLSDLLLRSNQLTGSVPPELGNLSNLRRLYLASNQLAGPLPLTLTNLAQLDSFWFWDTELCEPADPTFQAWLATIPSLYGTGIVCPSPPPPSSGPDFVIDSIEVTQAIQDLDNTVPLVAGKRTYARVHVRNVGEPSYQPVTARLCGPTGCETPNNSNEDIIIFVNPDRGNLQHSFYFELPDSWINSDGSIALSAEVNPAGARHILEQNTANNVDSETVAFTTGPPSNSNCGVFHTYTAGKATTREVLTTL